MILAKEEGELFFKLMWSLQFYVNKQRRILPQFKSVEEYAKASTSEKVQVRDVLWAEPGLIDAYIQDNPDRFSDEELEDIRKWKKFVSGKFHIFRLLKKHAIFISEKSKVYAVLGLYESLEDLLFGRSLPVLMEVILLPFKGKIVYDGMLMGYNIYFGAGIRASLQEIYLTAKQNGRIITTLEPELEKTRRVVPPKPERDWKVEIDDLVRITEGMKSSSAVPGAAFGLLRASARLSQAAVHQPDGFIELWRLEGQVRRALTKLRNVLDRVE